MPKDDIVAATENDKGSSSNDDNMVVDSNAAPRALERQTPEQQSTSADVLFLLCTLIALIAPACSIMYLGLYGAALIAIIVAAAWLYLFPSSCMRGGLIYSLAALLIVCAALLMSLVAVVRSVYGLCSDRLAAV